MREVLEKVAAPVPDGFAIKTYPTTLRRFFARHRVTVPDANSEFANAYYVLNLVGGLVQQGPRWRITEFVRLDNLTDRNYVGSVIVNEANGRFYEPSPRRSMSGGIQASLQF